MAEPDWRREVAQRLESYRARRRRPHPNEAQAAFPFPNAAAAYEAAPLQPSDSQWRAAEERRAPARVVERMEIAVTQSVLDFAGAEGPPERPHPWDDSTRAAPVLAVATLSERRRAGLLDAAFLLLAYGGFLALFGTLGGHIAFGKSDAAVLAATMALLYAQYFTLFTVFGGSTPGMLVRGLCVVSFDGGPPAPRQLLWRSFGYVVSGGTLLLGFLWALWDEDGLTWQDRISETYLTQAAQTAESAFQENPH